MDIGPTALDDDRFFQSTVSFFGYTRWMSAPDNYVGVVSASDFAVMYRGKMTTDDPNSVGTGFALYQRKCFLRVFSAKRSPIPEASGTSSSDISTVRS